MIGSAVQAPQSQRESDRFIDEPFSKAVDQRLCDLLGVARNNPLYKVLTYSLCGGARLRPRLCYGLGSCFGIPQASLDRVAASLEMIHSFSLIQDDLPCMDDDLQRRGKSTTHREFGEYQALLAANALFARAFELLSEKETHKSSDVRMHLVSVLAQTVGSGGMCLGQWMDLSLETSVKDIIEMFRLKSGVLCGASLQMPAIMAGRPEKEQGTLRNLGESLGIIYQIRDDILDCQKPNRQRFKRDMNIVTLIGHAAAKLELLQWTVSFNNQLAELGNLGTRLRGHELVQGWLDDLLDGKMPVRLVGC